MKKILNYEKEILFKTKIGEISSISLEEDFTIDGKELRGDFIVSGEYKINDISVNVEKFDFRLPLVYELDDNVEIETFKYEVDNFEYNFVDDILTVVIDLIIKYEEKNFEPIIPDIKEDDLNRDIIDDETNINTKQKEIIKENLLDNNIIDDDDAEYITYHIHIYKETDTIESIINEYSTSLDIIKTYNNIESINVGDKIIIPENK